MLRAERLPKLAVEAVLISGPVHAQLHHGRLFRDLPERPGLQFVCTIRRAVELSFFQAVIHLAGRYVHRNGSDRLGPVRVRRAGHAKLLPLDVGQGHDLGGAEEAVGDRRVSPAVHNAVLAPLVEHFRIGHVHVGDGEGRHEVVRVHEAELCQHVVSRQVFGRKCPRVVGHLGDAVGHAAEMRGRRQQNRARKDLGLESAPRGGFDILCPVEIPELGQGVRVGKPDARIEFDRLGLRRCLSGSEQQARAKPESARSRGPLYATLYHSWCPPFAGCHVVASLVSLAPKAPRGADLGIRADRQAPGSPLRLPW